MTVAGLLLAVLKFLNGDETAISRYFDRNRERKVPSASSIFEFRVAELVKSFGRIGNPESLDDFRYDQPPDH